MRSKANDFLDALERGEGKDVEVLRDEIYYWENRVEDLTSSTETLREELKDLQSQYDHSLKTAGSVKGRADEVVEELKNNLSILLKAIKEGTAKECLECNRTSRREAVLNVEYHAMDLLAAAHAVEDAETFLISEV